MIRYLIKVLRDTFGKADPGGGRQPTRTSPRRRLTPETSPISRPRPEAPPAAADATSTKPGRDTLEGQAREVFASQLAQVRPPWRQRRTPEPSSTSQSRPEATPMAADATSTKPAFEYWDFPDEAAVREPVPAAVSDTDRSSLEDALRAGAAGAPDAGEKLFVVLGLDFGTSSTKTIARLPYEPGEPTFAIPAPAVCRSGDHPYLWRTVLWLRDDGAFRPWPEPGAAVLNSLKQGLIQGRCDKALWTSEAGPEVTRAQAGVAWLAFAIRYARGWLLRHRPDVFRGRKPVWSVNVGMPAASYDDPKLVGPYRRIGAAALRLAKVDSPVTVESVRRFLDDPRVAIAGASKEDAEELGVAVIPETAAEATGFAKSTRGAPGLYLLVDVGAMTLDVCTFRLKQNMRTEDLYSFMAAQVRPLGVDALHWFLAEGRTEPEFVGQCRRALRTVVWHTRRCRDPHAEAWKPGNGLPVFLAGGGAGNRLHRNEVDSLGQWLTKVLSPPNDGSQLLELPIPDGIELPEPMRDFGRLAVAWGLSHPPTEIGEIRPMRDVEDIPARVKVDWEYPFISKDQV